MAEKIWHLVYTSEASIEVTPDLMAGMLQQARESNQKRNITGLLLYGSGNFVQLLEGPREKVLATYERIKTDARHQNVSQWLWHAVDRRLFPEWKMGMLNLQEKQYLDERRLLNSATPANPEEEDKARQALAMLQDFRQQLDAGLLRQTA